MAQSNAKDRLVNLLDRKAFQPVLDAAPDDYSSDADKRALSDVQDATRRTQKRYREQYGSADEVWENFQDDLSSDEAQEVHRRLERLGLPTLKDVQGEAERLAGDLGITR